MQVMKQVGENSPRTQCGQESVVKGIGDHKKRVKGYSQKVDCSPEDDVQPALLCEVEHGHLKKGDEHKEEATSNPCVNCLK